MERVSVLIASPNDVTDERDSVLRVFTRWNNANVSTFLHAVMWEHASVPTLGGHPQQILNRSMVPKSDLLLAIFWSKLGTPTPMAASGTVDEIREFIETHGPARAMVYFCQRDLPHDVDTAELTRLREFKAELRSQGLYHEYRTVEQFENDLYRHLDVKVRDLIDGRLPLPRQKSMPTVSDDAHADRRIRQPIDFGTTLSAIARGFADRMKEFAAIDGAGPDKFLDLGAHVYNSVAMCLDRFLAYSASGLDQANREVVRQISAKLKKLAASSDEYLKKGFPYYWDDGDKISDELQAHVTYLKSFGGYPHSPPDG
jgi:hypothetical protein